MRLLTTVANDGKVHFGSAERGAPDEGVPLCGALAWGLPRTQMPTNCRRCWSVWLAGRVGGAVASLLPVDHPASRLPAVGSTLRLARGVTVGEPFAAAWPPRVDVEVLEVLDLRPHDLPHVAVRVERVERATAMRRAGCDPHGVVVGLEQLDGYAGRLDLDEGPAVYDPTTGLPRGLDVEAATRAAVWRGTGRSSFERTPA